MRNAAISSHVGTHDNALSAIDVRRTTLKDVPAAAHGATGVGDLPRQNSAVEPSRFGGGFYGMVGSSPNMQGVYRTIEAAARSKASVLITGESGTGKELCAEAIHSESNRRGSPFVALNCAAIPRELMESEVFGHAKGSFTGATENRIGSAHRADSGTLFLDELCEMDTQLQAKLLRFVQTGTFQKVGGRQLEKVDVRFVCATNRDPLKEVDAGRFREDLYYRLNVIAIHLPPLRERESDAIEIARRMLITFSREEGKSFKRFTPEVEAVIATYQWPGNVRQLANVIRNIVVLNDGDTVDKDILPPPLNGMSDVRPVVLPRGTSRESSSPLLAVDALAPLAVTERRVIEHAIAACNGNIPRAAEYLGVAPSTLYRKRQMWERNADSAETIAMIAHDRGAVRVCNAACESQL